MFDALRYELVHAREAELRALVTERRTGGPSRPLALLRSVYGTSQPFEARADEVGAQAAADDEAQDGQAGRGHTRALRAGRRRGVAHGARVDDNPKRGAKAVRR